MYFKYINQEVKNKINLYKPRMMDYAVQPSLLAKLSKITIISLSMVY
jgi:hypothetical protein